MACLAVDMRVSAFDFGIGNIGMTAFAGLVSGEFERVRSDLTDGRGTIVSVLPEGFGNDVAADHQKNKERYHKKSRKPEKMSGVFKTAHEGAISQQRAPKGESVTSDVIWHTLGSLQASDPERGCM